MGIRKTFAKEFSRIFVYNLRGNQRTSGEASRKEGGKVFGSGSRTQVAVCILIKNSANSGPAEIRYRDVGDYLTREQKLDILEMEESFEGTDWATIVPNEHGDWINHRDERYDSYQPLGDKVTKGQNATVGMFLNYSNGLKTNRDAWVYNFSSTAVVHNVKRMIATYEESRALLAAGHAGSAIMDPTRIAWGGGLQEDLKRLRKHEFSPSSLMVSMYRPYCKQIVYFDSGMNERVYQLPKLFPTPRHPNVALIMSSPGASKSFSVVITDCLPNLHLIHTGQAFALYSYELVADEQIDLFAEQDAVIVDGYRRKDNVTDATLSDYREFYGDGNISKEDVFYYVYGIVSCPQFVSKYSADLAKLMPRIPKVKDFWGFSKAGRALADLHLNYEAVEPYNLEEIVTGVRPEDDYDFYRVNKLSFGARKDRSRIIFNQRITLAGIPEEAFEYQVNGKSALEWIIDRYQVTTHKDSLITNDPNDYCREVGNPRYIVDLIKRIVTVSVETNKIVGNLPALEVLD